MNLKLHCFLIFTIIGPGLWAQNLEIYQATGYSDPQYSYDEQEMELTIDFWVKNDGFNNSDATKIVAILINKDKDDEETEIDSYDLPGLSYSPNAGANLHHVEEWTISLDKKDLEDAEYKVRFHINPDKTAFEQNYQDNAMTFGSSFDFVNAMGISSNGDNRQSVNIYPNPASDKITVEPQMENVNDLQVRIYDLSGKLLLDDYTSTSLLGTQSFQIDLGTVDNGTYIFTISSPDGDFASQRIQVIK